MFNKISAWFYRNARGWLVLILLPVDLLFAGVLFPLIQGMIQDDTGGIQPLDLMIFSSPDKLFDMVSRYGDYNRHFYRNVELTVDIIYPLVYLFFFGFLMSWLLQRGARPESNLRKFNLLPLGAWFFDLLENLSIVSLIALYPSRPITLAWGLIAFIHLKWLFACGSILMIILGFVLSMKNKFVRQ